MAGLVLVCVTGQKTCEALILEGARIAAEEGASMSVLQVEKLGANILVMGRTTGMKERRVTAILAERVPGVRVQLVYE